MSYTPLKINNIHYNRIFGALRAVVVIKIMAVTKLMTKLTIAIKNSYTNKIMLMMIIDTNNNKW